MALDKRKGENRMSAIADVIISMEPGGHEFPVPPMVAAYINKLQRENAKLRKELNAVVARELPESPK
jgi:hypothetical protein